MRGNNSSVLIPSQHDQLIFDNVYVQATLIILYSVIFIICFVGNLAVVLVVALKWKMQSVAKFCLGNLAISDLTVGLFCIYQNLSTYLLEGWYFGEFMCKMYHFINSLCHTASILILIVIAVERYIALVYPFMSRQLLTLRGLVLIIVTVWLLSAAISCPRLFYFGLVQIATNGEKKESICVPRKSSFNSATADTSYFLMLYVFPLGIITILYTRIAFYLRESERTWYDDVGPQKNNYQGAPDLAVEYHARHSQIRSETANAASVEREQFVGVSENRHSDPLTPGTAFSFRVHLAEGSVSYGELLQRIGRKECVSMEPALLHLSRINGTFSASTRPSFSDDGVYTSRNISCEISHDAAANIMDGGRPFRGNRLGIQRGLGHESHQSCYNNAFYSSTRSFRVRKTGEMREPGANSVPSPTPAILSATLTPRGDSQRILYKYNVYALRKIRREQKKGVVRLLISIVVAFAVLNLPYHVRKLCMHYWPSFDMVSDTSTLVAPLTFLLMYANSAVNPILYAFMSNHFRNSLRELWHQCRYK